MSSSTKTTLRQALSSSSLLLLIFLILVPLLYQVPNSDNMPPKTKKNAPVTPGAAKATGDSDIEDDPPIDLDEELVYVLEHVLKVHSASPIPLVLAHQGILTADDLASYSFSAIDQLKYKKDDGSLTDVSKGDKQLLKMFSVYTHHLISKKTLPDQWDEHSADPADFRLFRMSPEVHTRISCMYNNQDYDQVIQTANSAIAAATQATTTTGGNPTGASLPPPGAAPITVYNKPVNLLLAWRKIPRKRDDYPTLASDKDWENFHRGLLSCANLHDTDKIFNSTYDPTNASQDEKDVWKQQQLFMYNMFNEKLKTDAGKVAVRDHFGKFNAQGVYKDILAHYRTSTAASLNKADVYLELINMTIAKWPGTQEQFLLNWHERHRLYAELSNSAGIDKSARILHVHTAISAAPNLVAVRSTFDISSSVLKQSLDFDNYWTLLISAAQTFDKGERTSTTQRRALRHDVQDSDRANETEAPSDHEPSSLHEQSLVDRSYYEVMQTTRNDVPNSTRDSNKRPDPRRFRLTDDQWRDIDVKGKKAWASLDPASKAIILRYSTKHKQEDSRRVSRIFAIHDDFDDDTLHLLVNRAAVYHLEDIEHAPDDDTKSSAITWDLSSMGTTSVNQAKLLTGDPRKAMSDRLGKPAQLPDTAKQTVSSTDISIGDKVVARLEQDANNKLHFRTCNTNLKYRVSKTAISSLELDMIDRGANGGVAGANMRLKWKHPSKFVDIEGYDQHCTADIPLGTCYNVVQTQRGEVVAVYHNYAFTGKGRSIHSTPQFESYRQLVDDKSIRVGGMQRITTVDGYILPVDIIEALPYIKTRRCTDDDWDNLPHVVMTSADEWIPSSLDYTHDTETFINKHDDGLLPDPRFDERGDYRHRHSICQRTINAAIGVIQNVTTPILGLADILQFQVHRRDVSTKEPDYKALRPHFLWQSVDVIKRTFDATTQMARVPMSNILRKWFKSPNPALNVVRRQEDVATDTIYAPCPAVDNGAIMGQFYTGTTTHVRDIEGMKTEKQLPDTLEDNIRKRGAPNRLLSDHATVEDSSRIKDLLRTLLIGRWVSEAFMQHQNPAERSWQDVKRITNTLLDRTGAPDDCWLLATEYVCFVLNHLATPSLRHRVPLQLLHGSTVDISILLRFVWYEPVYWRIDDASFPKDSREGYGYFVGFAENVGHALTYRILTRDTRKIIDRSSVRSTLPRDDPNLRLDIFDGETAKEIIKSKQDMKRQDLDNSKTHDGNPQQPMGSNHGEPNHGEQQQNKDDTQKDVETILEHLRKGPNRDLDHIAPGDLTPSDLIGRSILIDQEDGTRLRHTILKAIDKSDDDDLKNCEATRFLVSMGDDQHEDLMTYQQILDHLNKDLETDQTWNFRDIIGHQGPLVKGHPDYKGSSYNVQIEWENGEITFEPLSLIGADAPYICAEYASKNKLLETPGWKRFAKLARRQKKMIRMVNKAKIRSFRSAPQYMYGVEIPKDYQDAIRLDRINGNTKWQDCTRLEMQQLAEYKTFKSVGYKAATPQGFKRIRAHLVYATKHDGRFKARYVADGHLTDVPVDSVYSGVVSLKGLRAMIFIAELNGLKVWSTDVGNAYLEAYTLEKVCITAGPEFKDLGLESHTLIVVKALYGLRSSGLRWHERFADCLRNEGFFPCKAEPDIWMRDKGDHYEYIGVYVDDLAFGMKDPSSFVRILEKKYKFKLKGTGEMKFHLGCDFYRNEEGILCMAPAKYIERMVANYIRMFGEKPKMNVMSPIEKNDHPELDDSEFLDAIGIQQYQSIIGSTQWAVSLGRFDVHTAVMTLSSYRSAPRKGHLDRAKRLVRFLARFKHGDIKFRTKLPDYSDLPDHNVDWDKSIYHGAEEDIPDDAPRPLGKPVLLTRYVDANLYHDWVTGRSVTGMLVLANQTVFDWYSGKQPRVEAATYGSEFIATRKATEKSVEDRFLFRHLGVPVPWKDYMFGDNEAVVNGSTRVDAKLHKRHNALSFHKVREAIAAGFIAYYHVPSRFNLADVLSKHWGHDDVWMLLQCTLFWKKGDTADIPDPKGDKAVKNNENSDDNV